MIWGGFIIIDHAATFVNMGARYDPFSDS